MNRELKLKCERIAREHGAELTWVKGKYGFYIPGTNKISVGNTGNQRTTISIFCHELGHYMNYLNGKYYNYHHRTGKAFSRRFKTKDALIKYALRAEIYTDKVGRKNCKKLFPGVRYISTYRMNEQFYNMMYQKYFGGFFIIILENFVTNSLTNGVIYDSVY